MKFKIKNKKILITDPHVYVIADKYFAVEHTKDGLVTSTAQWLHGPNQWGFHNDVRLSQAWSYVKIGQNICRAAESAWILKEDIILEEPEYEVLLDIIKDPRPHPNIVPIPASLARTILEFVEDIIKAERIETNE